MESILSILYLFIINLEVFYLDKLGNNSIEGLPANIQLTSINLDVFHLDKSGKYDNDLNKETYTPFYNSNGDKCPKNA